MASPFFIPKEQCRTVFDRTVPPVVEIDPGSVVTFETGDLAYERLSRGESPDSIHDEEFNRITGPVRVRGAELGDALRVEILEIIINRAWIVWLPEYGPLGHLTGSVIVQPVPLDCGRAHIGERLSVPIEPSIGCIGVAPVSGHASTLEPAYPFGGNMDLQELCPGTTLWLPVQVPGGLLSLGDLHAAMGAAEPAWVGLEAAGQATVRIGLDKSTRLQSPRLRIKGATLCVAVRDAEGTLEEAAAEATRQAYDFLTGERGFSPVEAYAYVCARMSLRMGGPASPLVLAVIPDP